VFVKGVAAEFMPTQKQLSYMLGCVDPDVDGQL
jgi:hypothetical protein